MNFRSKQNSLGLKIGLGFGLVGLILLGAILVTLIEIQESKVSTQQLINMRSPLAKVSLQLTSSLDKLLIQKYDHLIDEETRAEVTRDIWQREITPTIALLKNYSDRLRSSNNYNSFSSILPKIENIEKGLNDLRSIEAEVLELKQNGKSSQAAQKWMDSSLIIINEIHSNIGQIIGFQETLAFSKLEEIRTNIEQLLVTDWFFLTLGILLCSILGVIITKSITGPIYNMVEITKSIAKGDLDQKVEITGTIEFEQLSKALNDMVNTFKDISNVTKDMAMGDYSHRVEVKSDKDLLAKSVNQMLENYSQIVSQADKIATGDYSSDIKPRSERDKLGQAILNMTDTLRKNKIKNKANNWLKDGIAQLSKNIAGTQDISALCSNAATEITRYLNAGIGVIYLFDKKQQKLILYGSHAFVKRSSLGSKFDIGEGIIGQVAFEGKPILITNPKPNERVINTGTADITPANIYAFPIFYEKDLIGVMEISSQHELSELDFNYLEQVSPIVATQIQSAQQQTLTEKLLKESKSLTEKLQTQQEELKSTNEELEQQTQILKASEEELRLKDEEQRAINKQLEERTFELENQKHEVERKTLDIQKARDALKLKAEELERASQYKSEFLANMSHELRTPLNSLLILAKMLADNEEGNLYEDQIESAKIMLKSGQDLLTLINDILDLAKVESGKLELHCNNVKLQNFVDTVKDSFSHVAEEKEIKFTTEIAPGLPEYIYTDEQRVGQIIRNLISNAIKFTEKGYVKFSISRPEKNKIFTRSTLIHPNIIAFRVEDTGIGIAEDKQRLVFESFAQADGTTSRKYGGTGLGLSISTELTNLLKGEIDLESVEGQGSIFTLYLPEEKVLGDTEDYVESTEQEVIKETDIPEVVKVSEPNGLDDDRNIISKKDSTLLIVEDDLEFSTILMNICRKKGFKVLHSVNAEDGLELVRQFKPKGILLDIGLPGMDGLTMLDQLKSTDSSKNIPVHILSASDIGKKEVPHGAIGYLMKPINQDQLETAINKIKEHAKTAITDLLIVEDNEEMLHAMTKLLKEQNVNITGVRTGQEALQHMNDKHYDCVILDLGLPDISGQEVLKQYHQKKHKDQPAIIIHTGKKLSMSESEQLTGYADSIILKSGLASMERLIEETQSFLHRVEQDIPKLNPIKSTKQPVAKETNIKPEFKNKKILLVDDDMRNTFALSKSLRYRGLNIVMAANGKTAIETLKNQPDIDLVLMDIMMPIMDGYTAMQEIRKNPAWQDLPMIALTAKVMKGDQEKCLEAGASDFIAKPLDVDQLIAMLEKWLN